VLQRSNIDELKQHLIEVWDNNNNNNTLIYIAPACRMTSEALDDLQQAIIDLAVSQWRQRLTACVHACTTF